MYLAYLAYTCRILCLQTYFSTYLLFLRPFFSFGLRQVLTTIILLNTSYTLASTKTHSGPCGSRSGAYGIPTGPLRPIPILRREKNLRDGLAGLDR